MIDRTDKYAPPPVSKEAFFLLKAEHGTLAAAKIADKDRRKKWLAILAKQMAPSDILKIDTDGVLRSIIKYLQEQET